MVREHKRRKGARRYQDYTDENLEECLDKIKTGKLTQRVAASTYNIPRSTLKNKLKNKHTKTVDRPPVLTFEEEKLILSRVQVLCDYGFPATEEDVRHYIKGYLDMKMRVVTQFRNNLPVDVKTSTSGKQRRKKLHNIKKGFIDTHTEKEGITYEAGKF